MGWGALAAGVLGAGASLYASSSANKNASNAANAAANSAQNAQVNIPALNSEVQGQSVSNASGSNALEQQYNPYINSLRQTSAAALGQYQTPSATTTQIQGNLMNQVNNNQSPLQASSLFTNSANAAQNQLNLGGQLDQDTQNAAMRAGAAQSGQMAGPGGGLGLGRDLSARDLGLSSMALENQRITNAASIGQQQSAYGLQAQQAQAANTASYSNILNQMQQDQFNKNLDLSQFTQGIQQPQYGLSPSSVAGIAVGNSNMIGSSGQQQAAIAAQQAAGQNALAGQLGGYGLSALGKVNWNNISGSGSSNGTPAASGTQTPYTGAPTSDITSSPYYGSNGYRG